MQADQFRSALRAKPFRAFDVHTGSGEKYPVKHPEPVSISASGKTVGVFLGEDQAIIDAVAITEVVASPSRAKGGAK